MFDKLLKKMKKNWKKAKKEAADLGDATLPLGEVVTKITGITEKDGPKGPYVTVERTLVEGPGKGLRCWKNEFPGSEKSLPYFLKWIERLGYEVPEDINELPDLFDEIVADENYELVSISENEEGFTDVKVKRVIDDYEPSEEDDDDIEEEDDEEEDSEDNEDLDEEEEDSEEEEDDEENEGEEDDETRQALIEFSTAQGLDVDEDMELDEVIGIIENHKPGFNKDSLTEDEIELLEEVGLESKLKKLAPKKKKATKKVVKKTAKKAAKKSAVKKKVTKKASKKSAKKSRKKKK